LVQLDEAVKELRIATLQTDGDRPGVIGHESGAQERWAVG
jgi:hypothetical protein